MARRKREWFPGAMYHIMHRGVRRKELFEEEKDYQVFLEILKSGLEKYDCILHAYCLMTNYIHLLLETTDIEVGKFMKFLSERYAMYMNHKYLYRGHVFESRYKSCLVTKDDYFLQTRVIHKLLRLARTSADLDGAEKIRMEDVKKVISCRDLDESNSKMVVVK